MKHPDFTSAALPAAAARAGRGAVAFVINGGAGRDGGWAAQNRAAIDAVAAGGPVDVVEGGAAIDAAVERALRIGCRTVVAGGGDGTLNAVAAHLVGRDVTFGVLPLGTLNHFARDLGVPLDPAEALRTIEAGCTTDVDVGEVNGRCFLNNSSLGLYVEIVRDRERQQHELGRSKWPAFASALWAAMRRYPFLTVTLTVDGRSVPHRTPFVFVGNNAYQTDGLQMGQRTSLQDGVLSVYVAERASRARLVVLALRALVGKVRAAKDFRVVVARTLRVETHRHSMRVATDGEICRLDMPLDYRILPRALRVIVPRRS